jgi:hypothetical protein
MARCAVELVLAWEHGNDYVNSSKNGHRRSAGMIRARDLV